MKSHFLLIVYHLILLLSTASLLRSVFYFGVCWFRRNRYVVFADATNALIVLDPAAIRLDVTSVVSGEVVHPSSRLREFVRLKLVAGEQKLHTGHYEGQAPALLAAIDALRAAGHRTSAGPWSAAT
ncbi:hypothetical protein [Brevundimonas sp. Root1279]|uniref:hypothetical protein n=1 Tax=Brevundimonas sp. Root1279 TaxID=1736443 RepID=UPI0006FAED03|nr:hypothetical protein [Brevundimonas sp. Root1279]KQW79671.1 hypothetical protein ASC65_14050 [Brevundimonas sp. Root1279]